MSAKWASSGHGVGHTVQTLLDVRKKESNAEAIIVVLRDLAKPRPGACLRFVDPFKGLSIRSQESPGSCSVGIGLFSAFRSSETPLQHPSIRPAGAGW